MNTLTTMIRYASFIMSIIFIFISCSSDLDYLEYKFYNQTNETIYIYNEYRYNSSDCISSKDAIENYNQLIKIEPNSFVNLFISGIQLYRYGKSATTQIIVFNQQTLTETSLMDLSSENRYDKLYIIPFEQLTVTDFAIFYTTLN